MGKVEFSVLVIGNILELEIIFDWLFKCIKNLLKKNEIPCVIVESKAPLKPI